MSSDKVITQSQLSAALSGVEKVVEVFSSRPEAQKTTRIFFGEFSSEGDFFKSAVMKGSAYEMNILSTRCSMVKIPLTMEDATAKSINGNRKAFDSIEVDNTKVSLHVVSPFAGSEDGVDLGFSMFQEYIDSGMIVYANLEQDFTLDELRVEVKIYLPQNNQERITAIKECYIKCHEKLISYDLKQKIEESQSRLLSQGADPEDLMYALKFNESADRYIGVHQLAIKGAESIRSLSERLVRLHNKDKKIECTARIMPDNVLVSLHIDDDHFDGVISLKDGSLMMSMKSARMGEMDRDEADEEIKTNTQVYRETFNAFANFMINYHHLTGSNQISFNPREVLAKKDNPSP